MKLVRPLLPRDPTVVGREEGASYWWEGCSGEPLEGGCRDYGVQPGRVTSGQLYLTTLS